MPIPATLRRLLSLPTASFIEDAVLDDIESTCRKLPGVTCRPDAYGNLLAHYHRRPPAGRRPLVFSAHTDHPGFVAREMIDARTLRADFRGGVDADYFPRQRVRFWSGGRWILGRVREVTRTREVYRLVGPMRLPEEVLCTVQAPVMLNSPGMWDFPDPFEKKGCVIARGCDDVAGAAGLLELLIRLARRKAATEVVCLFTRAEEVGFIGAIAACKARTLKKQWPIIAIETSSARGGGAEIGGGPVLRVGDKASIFTPELTDFCNRVAESLAKRRKSFKFQRKLMAGGTCETTAFMAYDYAATGICLALGNYHNMDTDRRRIGPEYVSISDWTQMVDWFEALALSDERRTSNAAAVRRDMEKRFAGWRGPLGGVQLRQKLRSRDSQKNTIRRSRR